MAAAGTSEELLVSSSERSFRRVPIAPPGALVAAYCSQCGRFIAAACSSRLLDLLEGWHRCLLLAEAPLSRQRFQLLLHALAGVEPDLRRWLAHNDIACGLPPTLWGPSARLTWASIAAPLA